MQPESQRHGSWILSPFPLIRNINHLPRGQTANQLPQGNDLFNCKLKSVNSKLRYRNPKLAVITFMCYRKLTLPSLQLHGHPSSKPICLCCLWYMFPLLLLVCPQILGVIHKEDIRPFLIYWCCQSKDHVSLGFFQGTTWSQDKVIMHPSMNATDTLGSYSFFLVIFHCLSSHWILQFLFFKYKHQLWNWTGLWAVHSPLEVTSELGPEFSPGLLCSYW